MMRIVSSLVLLSLACGPALAEGAAARDGTITKVVKLLQEMLDDSKTDGIEDRDLFAKYKCYCDTNTMEKTASIKENTEVIAAQTGEIDKLSASSGKLSVESASLQKQLEDNEASRDSATSLREKQHEDFVAQETDMVAAEEQMDKAIDTLAAIGADQTEKAGLVAMAANSGFMPPYMAKEADGSKKNVTTSVDPASMLKVTTAVKRALKAASIFLNKAQKKTVTGFLQAPFTGEYSAQSGEIVGILKNMRDTFKANLATARGEEAKQLKGHEDYIGTMEDARDEADETLTAKQETLGSNDDALATARESLETATTTKTEDEEFLASLTDMCTLKQKEYEDRKMVRMNEEAAIAQAISILNTDAAVDSFGSVDATESGATGFIQISRHTSVAQTSVRRSLSAMLKKAARKSQSLRMAKIAVMMESNPFDFVAKEMKKQIVVIDKEEKADDDEKAWCDGERESSDETIDTKAKNIDRLAGEVDTITDELDNPETGLKATLAAAQEDLKTCKEAQDTETEERRGENANYQKVVANLVSAEKVLDKAVKVLQKFYDWLKLKDGAHHYVKHEGKDSGGSGIKRMPEASEEELETACSEDPNCAGFSTSGWLKSAIQGEEKWYDVDDDSLYVKEYDAALLQKAAKKEDPAPPEAEFKKNQDSKGGDAIGMLEFILEETKKEEVVTHETEEGAQSAFEEEMAKLTEEQNVLLDTISSTEAGLAEKEKTKEQTIVNHGETEKDKKATERYLVAIKPGCDFMDENLDSRKAARKDEKASLKDAIEQMQATPEYKQLAAQEDLEALGDCKDTCVDNGLENVKCLACRNDTSEAGYCTSHPGTEGC
jgi:hypothetical protein